MVTPNQRVAAVLPLWKLSSDGQLYRGEKTLSEATDVVEGRKTSVVILSTRGDSDKLSAKTARCVTRHDFCCCICIAQWAYLFVMLHFTEYLGKPLKYKRLVFTLEEASTYFNPTIWQ